MNEDGTASEATEHERGVRWRQIRGEHVDCCSGEVGACWEATRRPDDVARASLEGDCWLLVRKTYVVGLGRRSRVLPRSFHDSGCSDALHDWPVSMTRRPPRPRVAAVDHSLAVGDRGERDAGDGDGDEREEGKGALHGLSLTVTRMQLEATRRDARILFAPRAIDPARCADATTLPNPLRARPERMGMPQCLQRVYFDAPGKRGIRS